MDPSSVTYQPFELDTGVLCLDFSNTWEDRGRPETERLNDVSDLLAFAAQSGITTSAIAAELNKFCARQPQEAQRAFSEGRKVRERIYRIASAQAAGRAPAPQDLESVNQDLAAAYHGQRLRREGKGYHWEWPQPENGLTPILHPILRSFGELLASADLERLRECGGPTCTWLFLDRSPSGSRRWCSMKTCGNRAKARRHYRRRKSLGSSV